MSYQPPQMADIESFIIRAVLFGKTRQQLRPIKRQCTRGQRCGYFGSVPETGRCPTQTPSGLMRDISPSRSPINDRPVPISQMRLPTTLLRHRRHLNQTNRGNLTLSTSNQLIQPIFGVTPQLHDPNVQPGCDKKPISRTPRPGTPGHRSPHKGRHPPRSPTGSGRRPPPPPTSGRRAAMARSR